MGKMITNIATGEDFTYQVVLVDSCAYLDRPCTQLGRYQGFVELNSDISDDLKLRILRQLADQLGYRIAKRSVPSDPNRAIRKYLDKGKQK